MDDRYLEILRSYWGYDHFRGIQEDIIASIGDGRDTLTAVCFLENDAAE